MTSISAPCCPRNQEIRQQCGVRIRQVPPPTTKCAHPPPPLAKIALPHFGTSKEPLLDTTALPLAGPTATLDIAAAPSSRMLLLPVALLPDLHEIEGAFALLFKRTLGICAMWPMVVLPCLDAIGPWTMDGFGAAAAALALARCPSQRGRRGDALACMWHEKETGDDVRAAVSHKSWF